MTYCVSDMNNTVNLLMKTLNSDKQNQITLAAQYHNAALFHFKAYPRTLSLPLLAFTINRLLYFGGSSAVSRSLTSSISSHLCCCAHTEIRRPTDISTVMLQCKHQQLSLKDQQTSFTSCLPNRGTNMTQSQFLLHATETSCHFSI